MVALEDINKSIVKQVKQGLINTAYNAVGFSSTDIKEEIIRPCFYVEFFKNKTGKFNASNKERKLTTKLYYFALNPNKYKLELMEIQDLLEGTFLEGLKINDNFIINIDDGIEFDIDKQNGFLTATFDLYTIEEIPQDESIPYMDNLQIN
ncbi:hypothetical protein AGR56_09110 [Clostridium sp. DMHC 10]|uniref:phage tail terminator family protein n=1 Tax=Clostridium sp. DMHC 10 TaxID=747377 RepID=UPI00069D5C9D|nr:hypothetical protein [Clostridium sp. DMHC 10]KOF56813.1 hypothetical protein AGR56_09110 [Clostridium sp. DMHC 10]